LPRASLNAVQLYMPALEGKAAIAIPPRHVRL
jgi:hypothetical protein